MFNDIALSYDFLNNIISFFTHGFIKKRAIKSLKIKPCSYVLDLCCGTGDLARIVKENHPESEVFGIDFSGAMIEIASKKVPKADFFVSDATKTGFKDSYFNYILMGFGLRNIENRTQALREIYRILKKDGYFLHIDFGKKNFFNKIYDFMVLFLAKIFSKNFEAYKYLLDSKNAFLEPDELIKEFKSAGFKLEKVEFCCFNLISFQVLSKN